MPEYSPSSIIRRVQNNRKPSFIPYSGTIKVRLNLETEVRVILKNSDYLDIKYDIKEAGRTFMKSLPLLVENWGVFDSPQKNDDQFFKTCYAKSLHTSPHLNNDVEMQMLHNQHPFLEASMFAIKDQMHIKCNGFELKTNADLEFRVQNRNIIFPFDLAYDYIAMAFEGCPMYEDTEKRLRYENIDLFSTKATLNNHANVIFSKTMKTMKTKKLQKPKELQVTVNSRKATINPDVALLLTASLMLSKTLPIAVVPRTQYFRLREKAVHFIRPIQCEISFIRNLQRHPKYIKFDYEIIRMVYTEPSDKDKKTCDSDNDEELDDNEDTIDDSTPVCIMFFNKVGQRHVEAIAFQTIKNCCLIDSVGNITYLCNGKCKAHDQFPFEIKNY